MIRYIYIKGQLLVHQIQEMSHIQNFMHIWYQREWV